MVYRIIIFAEIITSIYKILILDNKRLFYIILLLLKNVNLRRDYFFIDLTHKNIHIDKIELLTYVYATP